MAWEGSGEVDSPWSTDQTMVEFTFSNPADPKVGDFVAHISGLHNISWQSELALLEIITHHPDQTEDVVSTEVTIPFSPSGEVQGPFDTSFTLQDDPNSTTTVKLKTMDTMLSPDKYFWAEIVVEVVNAP